MEKSEMMVQVNHVKKAYKGNVLYTDLNFSVERGESCAIVGVNGSGKSVLLKMICGLVRPDEGEITVGGEKLEKGKFPKDIGVILDNAGFLPNETGLKNLSIIAGILRKVTKDELEEADNLAFDHACIILYAYLVLQKEANNGGTIVFDLTPERFTLTELQRVYEFILGRPLFIVNFRRKIMDYVLETDDVIKSAKEAFMVHGFRNGR